MMLSLGIFDVVSILSIEEVCVAALVHAVMTISGSTFHPLLIILSIGGLYFYILVVKVSYGILSLQYVNSINYLIRLSLDFANVGD